MEDWEGVWKWCEAASGILDQFFYQVTPQLDLLVIQMDADVSRKEKEVHCLCKCVSCDDIGKVHPLKCEKLIRGQCAIKLPCESHMQDSKGYEEHLEGLIREWLKEKEKRKDVLITVPCDSTDAWIAAAYQDCLNIETIKNPWESIIAKKKEYHGIRIPGGKKSRSVYRKFLPQLCEQWKFVTEQCDSAKSFDNKVRNFFI